MDRQSFQNTGGAVGQGTVTYQHDQKTTRERPFLLGVTEDLRDRLDSQEKNIMDIKDRLQQIVSIPMPPIDNILGEDPGNKDIANTLRCQINRLVMHNKVLSNIIEHLSQIA